MKNLTAYILEAATPRYPIKIKNVAPSLEEIKKTPEYARAETYATSGQHSAFGIKFSTPYSDTFAFTIDYSNITHIFTLDGDAARFLEKHTDLINKYQLTIKKSGWSGDYTVITSNNFYNLLDAQIEALVRQDAENAK